MHYVGVRVSTSLACASVRVSHVGSATAFLGNMSAESIPRLHTTPIPLGPLRVAHAICFASKMFEEGSGGQKGQIKNRRDKKT